MADTGSTPARTTWTGRDYLGYLVRRTGQVLRAGVWGQMVAIVAVALGWVWAAAHDHTVVSYVGAAVPKVLAPKVSAGAKVVAEVSPSQVRFVETPAHGGPPVVLGAFPRGLGYAHLGTATAIGRNVLHDLLPWVPLVLIAAAVVSMVLTIAHHRLRPSALSYVTDGRRRTAHQLFVRRGRPASSLTTKRVDTDDVGRTLAAWARRYGGNHGAEAIPELVTLNQTRRQPSFGSVLDANTRLRLGWNLVVPADPSGLARGSVDPSGLARGSVAVTRTGECRELAAGGPN